MDSVWCVCTICTLCVYTVCVYVAHLYNTVCPFSTCLCWSISGKGIAAMMCQASIIHPPRSQAQLSPLIHLPPYLNVHVAQVKLGKKWIDVVALAFVQPIMGTLNIFLTYPPYYVSPATHACLIAMHHKYHSWILINWTVGNYMDRIKAYIYKDLKSQCNIVRKGFTI